MYVRSDIGPHDAAVDDAARLRPALRTALALLCLAGIAAAALATRALVFEYTHGDREIVLRLLDKLWP
jgi:hypothetical protein